MPCGLFSVMLGLGFDRPEPFVIDMQHRHAQLGHRHVITVTWGAEGAWAIDQDGHVIHQEAFPPPGGVIDSLGAGDTFNAGLIHAFASVT